MEGSPDSNPGQVIADLILEGRKIEAIKVVCDSSGVSLKEGKEMVERLQEELAAKHPHLAKPNKPGCAVGPALVMFSTLGALALLALRVID